MPKEPANTDLEPMTVKELAKEWRRTDLRTDLAFLESEHEDAGEDSHCKALLTRREAIETRLAEIVGADADDLFDIVAIVLQKIERANGYCEERDEKMLIAVKYALGRLAGREARILKSQMKAA